MMIVDNNCLSFALNINNGIPILPFFDNFKDEELKHLTFYLKCFLNSKIEDVRLHNRDAFGLLKIMDTYSNASLSQRMNTVVLD